jgi:cytochrome c biogenesis protein CcdA
MAFGLDKETHRRIHGWIKRLTDQKSWLMMPAALLLGAIVSSMELACTGQIYLPILAAINADGIDLRAVLLLLLYNFFFILPLAIITAMTVMGVGAQPVAAWARNHVFATKVAMAVLFAGLAVLMFSLI